MQLMRQFFTQEYGLFLVCLLLFLSNTTRGNSSNDPTGFPNEEIDYFSLDYPHRQVSTNQKFILLKDNTRYVNALFLPQLELFNIYDKNLLIDYFQSIHL